MKKSQFESLIREVIRETIRKVDGKYVVYPEKGGKRLGTHSTKSAAEKQLTAIHLNKETVSNRVKHYQQKPPVDWEKRDWELYENVSYTKPNFEVEWEEAIRYPELEQLGKKKWINIAQNGFITTYSKISDYLSNVDLDFNDLEEPKKKRFIDNFDKGNIEMPIAVKFNNTDYDLVAGNTRLAGLVKNQIDPKIWIVDISHLMENYADGKVKGKSRPGRVKKAGASCKGSVTDLRAKAKKYGGEKGKMYHWCANMKGGKKK